MSLATKGHASSVLYGQIAKHCMFLACIGAVPAVLTGSAEAVDTPSGSTVRRLAQTHAILNLVIFVSYVSQLFARRGIDLTSVSSFIANLTTVSMLAISGMIGKKMVFQYRMGSRPIRESIFVDQADTRAALTGQGESELRAAVDKMAEGRSAHAVRATKREVGVGG
jgi:uncharacterized membrane protein